MSADMPPPGASRATSAPLPPPKKNTKRKGRKQRKKAKAASDESGGCVDVAIKMEAQPGPAASSSRRIRLAKLRAKERHVRTNVAVPREQQTQNESLPRQSSSWEQDLDRNAPLNPLRATPENEVEVKTTNVIVVELVSMKEAPLDARSSDLPVDDGTERSTSKTPSPAASLPQTLLRVLCIAFVIIGLSITWMLTVYQHRDDLIALDCERLGYFGWIRPVEIAYCLCYIGASNLLRPQQKVGEVLSKKSSIKNRKFFARLTMFVMCAVSINSALIGYPQGLCTHTCTCGMCRSRQNSSTQVPSGLVDSADRNTKNVPANATASSSTIPTFATCSDIEAASDRSGHSDTKLSTCSSHSDSVIFPRICTVAPPMFSKAVSPENTSRSREPDKWLSSLNSLIGLSGQMFGVQESNILPVDRTCERREIPVCPKEEGKATETAATEVFFPTICDFAYKFCDRNGTGRSACPTATCCSMCNLMDSLNACKDGAHAQRFHLKTRLSNFASGGTFDTDLLAVNGDKGLVDEIAVPLAWAADSLLDLLNDDSGVFDWVSCVRKCETNLTASATWYGRPPVCLSNEHRSWVPESNTLNHLTPSDSHFASTGTDCQCDGAAQEWSLTVLISHGCAIFGVVVLCALQVWVAIIQNDERWVGFSKCCSALGQTKASILASIFSTLILGCLALELFYIASASSGASCLNPGVPMTVVNHFEFESANKYYMLCWVSVNLVKLSVVMVAILLPNGPKILMVKTKTAMNRRVKASAADRRTKDGRNELQKAFTRNRNHHPFIAAVRRFAKAVSGGKAKYDNAFSLSRGKHYAFARLVSEITEVLNQTIQFYYFADERTYSWIMSLSIVLMLNGLCLPMPFLWAKVRPSQYWNSRLVMAGLDSAFDIAYLLIALMSSDKKSFGDPEHWWVAILGVIVPVISIARRRSLFTRNCVAVRDTSRRISMSLIRRASAVNRDIQRGNSNVTADFAPLKEGHHAPRTEQYTCVQFFLSVLIAVYCILSGGIFARMATQGHSECRELLGEALWAGAKPKYVIVGGRGSCNLLAIESLSSVATKEKTVITRLPSALSRLARLESLVLSGHYVESDGASARVFDGQTLPKLTRLEFGDSSPISHALDLSGAGFMLGTFPPYVFQFMTALESLQLSDTNITCFPPREVLSRLERLRALNLSGSRISYLPPSVLFQDKTLTLDVSGTPVSLSLSWRGHDLGSVATAYGDAKGQFDWGRMARVLPKLTKLDISNNALQDAGKWLDLNALRHLLHLNVSHNPKLTPARPAEFSWWKTLSHHPTMEFNASFVGLSNVGLGPDHMRLWKKGTLKDEVNANDAGGELTCRELEWIHRTTRGRNEVSLDLSQNTKFNLFLTWLVDLTPSNELKVNPFEMRNKMVCYCPAGDGCLFVDKAVSYLLMMILRTSSSVAADSVFQPGLRTTFDHIMKAVAQTSSIMTVHITQNKFGGTIPSEICQSSGLQVLNLARNQLVGSIPDSIGNLSSLKQLFIYMNNLTGSIPSSITKLTQLGILDLARNELTGSIPSNIGMLTKLKSLSLTGNNLVGSIPSSIGEMANLQVLALHMNKLSGSIPESITKLTKLVQFSIFGNSDLTGVFPPRVGNLCWNSDPNLPLWSTSYCT